MVRKSMQRDIKKKFNFTILYGSTRKKRLGIRFVDYINKQINNRGHNSNIVDPLEAKLPMLDKRYADYDKLKVSNVDITVISQRISISEKRENLEESISKLLNIEASKVNIKGKTADFLGLIGDKKASASLVTILLENA